MFMSRSLDYRKNHYTTETTEYSENVAGLKYFETTVTRQSNFSKNKLRILNSKNASSQAIQIFPFSCLLSINVDLNTQNYLCLLLCKGENRMLGWAVDSQPPVPILSHMNPIHTLSSSLSLTRFNNTLPRMHSLRLANGLCFALYG
jgi:hypothetical protein